MKKFYNSISNSSRREIKKTDAYKDQIKAIKNEFNLRFQDSIKNEKSKVRKLILLFQKRMATRRAIRQLTSLDKMYIKI